MRPADVVCCVVALVQAFPIASISQCPWAKCSPCRSLFETNGGMDRYKLDSLQCGCRVRTKCLVVMGLGVLQLVAFRRQEPHVDLVGLRWSCFLVLLRVEGWGLVLV